MEKSVDNIIFNSISETMKPNEVSSRYSPLALAYIGDSVYDLLVKRYFVMKSNMQTEKYHKKVSSIVSANSQCKYTKII